MARRVVPEESELLRLFRAAYEEGNRAWNAGDFRGAYGGLPDDFEYFLGSTWPNARPLRGPAEIVAFFEDFRGVFPDARGVLGEFIQADERTVIVGFEVSGTGAGSGVRTKMEIWQVWEVPDGRPVRVREYPDREAALEAVGVGEPASGAR